MAPGGRAGSRSVTGTVRPLLSVAIAVAVAACAPVAPSGEPPPLSIDLIWAEHPRVPLAGLNDRPPSGLVVRWDPRAVTAAAAETAAQRQCLAWDLEAQANGPRAAIGVLLVQHYRCAAPGTSAR